MCVCVCAHTAGHTAAHSLAEEAGKKKPCSDTGKGTTLTKTVQRGGRRKAKGRGGMRLPPASTGSVLVAALCYLDKDGLVQVFAEGATPMAPYILI